MRKFIREFEEFNHGKELLHLQGARQRIYKEEKMFDPTFEKAKQVPVDKHKKDGARRNEELFDIVKHHESLEGEMQSGRADTAFKRISIPDRGSIEC